MKYNTMTICSLAQDALSEACGSLSNCIDWQDPDQELLDQLRMLSNIGQFIAEHEAEFAEFINKIRGE